MREKLQCLYENLMWNNFRAVNKTRIGLLGSDRIGLWIGSDWIGSDRIGLVSSLLVQKNYLRKAVLTMTQVAQNKKCEFS